MLHPLKAHRSPIDFRSCYLLFHQPNDIAKKILAFNGNKSCFFQKVENQSGLSRPLQTRCQVQHEAICCLHFFCFVFVRRESLSGPPCFSFCFVCVPLTGGRTYCILYNFAGLLSSASLICICSRRVLEGDPSNGVGEKASAWLTL